MRIIRMKQEMRMKKKKNRMIISHMVLKLNRISRNLSQYKAN